MSLHILALAIYNGAGERRELRFDPGKVNIITGASKTGKTALIDIVDYCLGRNEFTVRSGVIRDAVSWYVLHVQLPNNQAVIGRPAPTGGAATTTDVFLEVGGELVLPPFSALHRTMNADALGGFLTEAVGITANENVPPGGTVHAHLCRPTSDTPAFLLFQPAEPDRRPQPDVLPPGGAVRSTVDQGHPALLPGGDRGQISSMHLQAMRPGEKGTGSLGRFGSPRRSRCGAENRSRAVGLLAEARNASLVGPATNTSADEDAVAILRGLLDWTPEQEDSPQQNTLATLQQAREPLLAESRAVQNEIEAARSFAAAEDEFGVEATDQKHRLTAINLFQNEPQASRCPLCETDLNGTVPKAQAIRTNLVSLEKQMAATTRQRPRLEAYLADREGRLSHLRQQLIENKAAIESLIAQGGNPATACRNRTVEQARVIGRISLFTDSLRVTVEDGRLQRQVDELRRRIAELEAGLSEDVIEDRLTSILQVISRTMSEWARRLDLEHSESPIGFDLNNLTAIAHRDSGPIRMSQMGSGENWMGYHVVTHLALQKWFTEEKHRPVPGLLMLDQPTQVYFPSDQRDDRSLDELADDDREAVKRLFKFIFDVTEALAPKLQVIITDHADLNEPWFQAAVKERWRGGNRLVPASWYTQAEGGMEEPPVSPAS